MQSRLTQRGANLRPVAPRVQTQARRVSPQAAGGRRRAVKVVAYREESAAAVALVQTAREFVDCWSTGCKMTVPSQEVLDDLTSVCTPDIRVQAVHPLGNVEFKGLEGLKKKLIQDANFKSAMRPSRLLLAAADEVQRAVFCLLECDEMGSMDEDVNLVLLELHCTGRTYGIIKLDFDVDAAGGAKVKGVTERMQLGPADACLLSMLYPDFKLHETMSDELMDHKESSGRMALLMASTWIFPREDIRAKPLKADAAQNALRSMATWCEARNSGKDAAALLSAAVGKEKFGLWDPYGVLPTVCGIRDQDGRCTYKGIEAKSHQNCVMNFDECVNRLNAIKENYLIECQMLDAAICTTHNAGFVHWRSTMKKLVHTKQGTYVDHEDCWPIEAMAVVIFHHDGMIKDTWMLRDPYEVEKEMMESVVATGRLN